MAIDLLRIPGETYIGQPFPTAINLGSPSQMAPRSVGVLIPWLVYGASTTKNRVGVNVNLLNAPQGNAKLLDKIMSVYIDNTQSTVPIYVFFPDTQCTITAPPNSAVTFPVITNDLKCTVYGIGFVTGQIPTTQLYFTNVYLQPCIDYEVNNAIALYKASPSIQRGNVIFNSDYGTPALGDQTQQVFIDVDGVTPTTYPLFGSPYARGYIYLVGLFAKANNISSGVYNQGSLFIESTGPSGLLYELRYWLANTVSNLDIIYQVQGTQLKLAANEPWRVRNAPQAGRPGSISLIVNYTVNENLV